jgi:hypothetical protein
VSLRHRLPCIAAAWMLLAGCGDARLAARVVVGEKLVPVEHVTIRKGGIEKECRVTAKVVGYAVPCPRLLPESATATPVSTSCRGQYVGWLIQPTCAPYQQIVFSSINWETTRRVGHFVITATPRRLGLLSAITYPKPPSRFDRILTVGHTKVAGHPAEIVKCLSLVSNRLYSGHTVFVWSIGDHTYLLGFHGTDRGARQLDEAVASTLQFVSS